MQGTVVGGGSAVGGQHRIGFADGAGTGGRGSGQGVAIHGNIPSWVDGAGD